MDEGPDGGPPRVAVLGVGLIGGSIGLAARTRLGAQVAGWGHRPETVARARALGALDREAESVADACADADLVFCAAPVARLPELVGAALAAAGPDAAVTDVGSTKRELVEEFGAEERFIGGHPLAGAETAGVENARADLFDGARWFLTPTGSSDGALYERLQRALNGFGARPQAIDAAAHDRTMATISALPHVVANALAAEAVAGAGGARPPEVGPSFRDATRVAGSNPPMWADIFAANHEAVADAVASLAARLETAAALIRAGEPEPIRAWHAAAGADRHRLLDAGLPGGPLVEVRISLPNRPGTIAALALALGEAGVNIEDMALHPAPDPSSGAVSIWIAGVEGAERAAARTRELGHAAVVAEPGAEP